MHYSVTWATEVKWSILTYTAHTSYRFYVPRRDQERRDTCATLLTFPVYAKPATRHWNAAVYTHLDIIDIYRYEVMCVKMWRDLVIQYLESGWAARSANASPGNIIWWTRRDAGFNWVGAVHTHGVKGLVVTESEGIKIDVGLGCCSRGRLTWKHKNPERERSCSGNQGRSARRIPVGIIPSGAAGGFKFGSISAATVDLYGFWWSNDGPLKHYELLLLKYI